MVDDLDDLDPEARLVYAAEDMLLREPKYSRQMSLAEIRDFVADVVRTRWFRNRFSYTCGTVMIHDGRGAQRAIGRHDLDSLTCHLTFPRKLRQKLIVLHELAHGLSGGGHGGWFCSTYLQLVRRFMGVPAWEDLRWSFSFWDVKVRSPSTHLPKSEDGFSIC